MYFFKILDASMIVGLPVYGMFDKYSEGGAMIAAWIYLALRHIAAAAFDRHIHNDAFYRLIELVFFFELIAQAVMWKSGGPLVCAFFFALGRYCLQECFADEVKPADKGKEKTDKT